jgi:adenylate cyclase
MSLEVNGELVPVGGGDKIPLLRETMTVGRRDSCDIPMRLPNVSGLHCELTFKEGYWTITDLRSTNGVKVNGVRVPKKLLHPGDTITIAKRSYTIEYTPPERSNAILEMMEDDVMGQSLLEKAGLEKPRREHEERPRRKAAFDPGDFLLQDDEEK